MFLRKDPNHTLLMQQAIFGSRDIPAPTLKEKILGLFKMHRKTEPEVVPDTGEPAGNIIHNALLSDLPLLSGDIPIVSNPMKVANLPDKFLVVTTCDIDPNSVQIELFMPDIAEARFKLLDITTKLERGATPQITATGLQLTSDRLVVRNPSIPETEAAVCWIKPRRKARGLM